MAKVVIGGTFEILHKGHKELLKRAFEAGSSVFIGLTSDEYVKRVKKERNVLGFGEREKKLRDFVSMFGKKFEIMPIKERFGPSTTGNFDVIVVSEETHPTALEINKIREKNGLKALEIIRISYVLAEDGKPISTTRIIRGEIDEDGKLKTKSQ